MHCATIKISFKNLGDGLCFLKEQYQLRQQNTCVTVYLTSYDAKAGQVSRCWVCQFRLSVTACTVTYHRHASRCKTINTYTIRVVKEFQALYGNRLFITVLPTVPFIELSYLHIYRVLISPEPDLLPDVLCLMVRIFRLMPVLWYIYSINIPPIMIINRIYENQNLLSL